MDKQDAQEKSGARIGDVILNEVKNPVFLASLGPPTAANRARPPGGTASCFRR